MSAARAYIMQGPTENCDLWPMTLEQGVITLMAHIAMKDLPWNKYLAGPEKGHMIKAHEKELDALLTTKLKASSEWKEQFWKSLQRIILNLHVLQEQRLMGGVRQLPALRFWNTSDPGSGRREL